MWPSLVLAFAVTAAPAQTGKLELTNVRAAYDPYGVMRLSPPLKLLPGDMLNLAFDIVGLQTDLEGRVKYATGLEIIGKVKGEEKSLFKQKVGETFQVNILGGKARDSVHVKTGLDQAEGKYRVKVTIEDLIGKREASFEREFEVLASEFGLVRFQFSYDPGSQLPAPNQAIVGQMIYVHAVAIGMKRDAAKDNQAGVTVEMTVLDDQGKSITMKPLTGDFKNLTADVTYVPFRFDLPLQKAGTFKVVLKATDLVGKKSASLTIPLTVTEPK